MNSTQKAKLLEGLRLALIRYSYQMARSGLSINRESCIHFLAGYCNNDIGVRDAVMLIDQMYDRGDL